MEVPTTSFLTIYLFTSPRLLRLLADKGMAATGTLRPNRAEGAPLKEFRCIEKGTPRSI